MSPRTRYVEGLRRGELLYQFSVAGNQAIFYPRAVSPYDANEVLEWRTSKGMGTVYSTTQVHARGGAYNVALIDCDEGFRLMSRVEGLQAKDVRIGSRVRLQVASPESEDDDPYPVFVPMEAE